jgi:hypothetical protein
MADFQTVQRTLLENVTGSTILQAAKLFKKSLPS